MTDAYNENEKMVNEAGDAYEDDEKEEDPDDMRDDRDL